MTTGTLPFAAVGVAQPPPVAAVVVPEPRTPNPQPRPCVMDRPARVGDPQSSWDAARRAQSGAASQRQRVLEALASWTFPPTAGELAEASGIDFYTVCRRLPELERANLVARVRDEHGVIICRPCGARSGKAQTWRLLSERN